MSQDEYTIVAYLIVSIAVRSAGSILALLVFLLVAYTSLYASFVKSIDDVYLFPVYGSVYLILAKLMRKINEDARFGCIFMSLYCFYYSFDSWAYGEYKTWVWQNHEVIIATAHALILLLLSKAHIALVYSRLHLLWNYNCSGKG